MSSGQKSCYDDEDAWDAFRSEVNLPRSNWGCYSNQARIARVIHKNTKATGELLYFMVNQQVELERFMVKQQDDLQAFAAALALVKNLGLPAK